MARWPRAVGNWGVKAQAERPRVQGHMGGIWGGLRALLQPGARLLSAPKPTQGSALCWGPRARPVPAPFVLPSGCSPSPPGVRFGCPVPSKVPLLSVPSSYIYQKRWVKLDADYLRYFDSEKVRGEVSGGGTEPPTASLWAPCWHGGAKGQRPRRTTGARCPKPQPGVVPDPSPRRWW